MSERKRRAPGMNREVALRALRQAGDDGCTRPQLQRALDGSSPNDAIKQLRRVGHHIDARKESLGPPFHIQTIRYVLSQDATPPLFEDAA